MQIESLFNRADELHDKGEFISAFRLFSEAAESGDTAAMLRMASMYTCGEGVQCDYTKAEQLELNAIESGDLTGLVNLGITYRFKGDIRNSKKWFLKAIEAGDGSGALELAKLYLVSDNEIETTRNYLELAINNPNMCEADIEEAKALLAEL